jgi:CheY-like chemotaxis protein
MSLGLRILVVEDEPETGSAVRRFLEYRGHKVDLAESESMAIRMADELQPEVMICDWKLSDNDDGVEVARRVKSRHDIPVVLVTGHRLAQARKKARDSEVEINAYRRKPLSLADLANLVESLAIAG